MRPTNVMSSRIYLPIHHWRINRNCSCKLFPGHRPARHLLRSSPLPLRPIYRRSICNPSRLHPLIPSLHWIHSTLHMSQSPIRSNVCRSKPYLLPSTLPRFSRHASTILRLSRCLHTMKYYFFSRIINLYGSSNYANVHRMRSFRIQTQSIPTRTSQHKRRMNLRLPTSIPHLRRTSLCPSSRKEGVEPPYVGFKPTAYNHLCFFLIRGVSKTIT